MYSRMIRSREKRALDALLSLFSMCEWRRPTASCSLAAVRGGNCVRASWLYSFIVPRIDRYWYSYFCVCLALLLYHAGSAPLDFCFGLVAKINIIIRAKSKQASCAEMVLRSFCFCSCDSAVRFLDSETSSKRRLLLRPAPRRVHFARP